MNVCVCDVIKMAALNHMFAGKTPRNHQTCDTDFAVLADGSVAAKEFQDGSGQ